jgi:hypothetical protein
MRYEVIGGSYIRDGNVGHVIGNVFTGHVVGYVFTGHC